MHIEYSITKKDFILAQHLAMKRSPQLAGRWMFSVIPAVGGILLLSIVYMIVMRGLGGLLPGLFAAVGLLWLPLFTRWNMHRLYNSSTNLRGSLSLDADNEGLSFRGPTFSSRLSWDHYYRLLEDDHSFLIFQNPGIFNVIPKRGLTPEQIAELHEIISAHIPARGPAARK